MTFHRIHLLAKSFFPFAARFILRHPKKWAHLAQYWSNYVGRYGKIAGLTSQEIRRVEAVFYELECQEPLFKELNGLQGMGMHPLLYYSTVRLMQPEVVVETGVMEGFSSRFILLAMAQNGRGTLHSIDFPNQDVELVSGGRRQRDMMGERSTGWLVPDHLRSRWNLLLGDARVLLPQVMAEHTSMDMFIHDSLHSYDHMMFEFQTAWPCLRQGGILFCDDIDYNTAFFDFARKVQLPTIRFNDRVGAMKK